MFLHSLFPCTKPWYSYLRTTILGIVTSLVICISCITAVKAENESANQEAAKAAASFARMDHLLRPPTNATITIDISSLVASLKDNNILPATASATGTVEVIATLPQSVGGVKTYRDTPEQERQEIVRATAEGLTHSVNTLSLAFGLANSLGSSSTVLADTYKQVPNLGNIALNVNRWATVAQWAIPALLGGGAIGLSGNYKSSESLLAVTLLASNKYDQRSSNNVTDVQIKKITLYADKVNSWSSRLMICDYISKELMFQSKTIEQLYNQVKAIKEYSNMNNEDKLAKGCTMLISVLRAVDTYYNTQLAGYSAQCRLLEQDARYTAADKERLTKIADDADKAINDWNVAYVETYAGWEKSARKFTDWYSSK